MTTASAMTWRYSQDGSVPVDDMRIGPDGRRLLANVSRQRSLVAASPATTTVDLSDKAASHWISGSGMRHHEA